MRLRYYQYDLGDAKLEGGEMHASLHSVEFHKLLKEQPFIKQVFQYLTEDNPPSDLIKKHILRGINFGDKEHTRIIMASDFPLKKFEPGYYNQKEIEFGLSGGDFFRFNPDFLNESYYFFYETKHPFSQWHKCEFHVDGIQFSSAEQYMMSSKAKLFKDFEIADEILKTRNVKKQKALGRQVKNFNQEIWTAHAPQLVFQGNWAKFDQNQNFKKLLLSTKGKTIVEASPYDKIWGIGLTAEDSRSANVAEWQGTNWLGIVLTEIRELMLDNEETIGYLTRKELATYSSTAKSKQL